MSKKYIREACVEGLGQALAAQKQGADRIELCANLSEDGLTPEIDVIMAASEQLDIPIRVMIRPRAGDFVYSKEEIQEMIARRFWMQLVTQSVKAEARCASQRDPTLFPTEFG